MADGDLVTLDAALGFQQVRAAGPERATVEYRVLPHMCHSGGIAQGGFVCAWIDATMARVLSAIHGPRVLTLTLEIKISYLAATRSGIVIAEAWAIGGGKSLAFVEGHLLDAEARLLAKGSATFKLLRS